MSRSTGELFVCYSILTVECPPVGNSIGANIDIIFQHQDKTYLCSRAIGGLRIMACAGFSAMFLMI